MAQNILQLAKEHLDRLGGNEIRFSALKNEFGLLYADTVAVKIKESVQMPLSKRFNVLYRFLVENESVGGEHGVVATRCRLLRSMDELLGQFETEKGPSITMKDLEGMLSNNAKKEHFAALSAGAKNLLGLRAKVLAEARDSMMEQKATLDGDRWMELANICYALLKDFKDPASAATVEALLEAHVEAIGRGSTKARQLFPDLMAVAEDMAGKDLNLLEAKLDKLEPWLLLPWANQLLSAGLDDSDGRGAVASVWRSVVLKMARIYPEALKFPYLVSKQAGGGKMASNELDSILALTPVQDRLVKGFGCVAVPEAVLYDCLMKEGSNDVKVERLRKLEDNIASQPDMYGPAYRMCARKHLTGSNRFKASQVESILNKVRDDLGKPGGKSGGTSLSDYTPCLAEFHSSGGSASDSVELPGQYVGLQRPRPEQHVRLTCFQDGVTIFSSLRKPIAVGLVGDDGRTRRFIVKTGEDLRQDERIQQVFAVANRSFAGSGMPRGLRIHTYGVVPLTTEVGLIECVDCVVPYSKLATPNNYRPAKAAVRGKENFDKIIKMNSKQRKDLFEKALEISGSTETFSDSIKRLSNCPDGFYFLRDNFVRSHALHSIVGWLVSLGDRHADNLLVSTATGDSVAIDFGYAFGATAFLPVPELLPFRLTPQIEELMQPLGASRGPFRETAVLALSALRADSSVLLAALKLFVREPSVDWLKLAKRTNLKSEEFNEEKIRTVEKKLSGFHPSVTLLEELKVAKKKVDLKAVQEVIQGDKGSLRRRLASNEKKKCLCATEQVDCLIEAATDRGILACAFGGWKATL